MNLKVRTAHGFILVNSHCVFSSLYEVVLSPTNNVTVCLGANVTFTCRTTGGALLWEADNLQVPIDDATDMPGSLGIFRFSVLGVLKEGAMVVEVNSTATTLVGVRLSDDNVMLGCREATNFTRPAEEAVLRVSGTYMNA